MTPLLKKTYKPPFLYSDEAIRDGNNLCVLDLIHPGCDDDYDADYVRSEIGKVIVDALNQKFTTHEGDRSTYSFVLRDVTLSQLMMVKKFCDDNGILASDIYER